MNIIEIDGREFADLGGGVLAEIMDIAVVEDGGDAELAELDDLFGPGVTSVASVRDLPISSMLREGDGARITRTRRSRGARSTTRRAAIAESIRTR